MKPSTLQELTRKRNWALFQIKGARGSLYSAAASMGLTCYAVRNELDALEDRINELYGIRKAEILKEREQNELSARNN